jgi:guanylate kinase
MPQIYCLIGKSATGKDSIYEQILQRGELPLRRIIPYTTRPIRPGESEGREYHFCDEAKVQQLEQEGRIIELRAYETVYGIWKYFTVDDGAIDLAHHSYLYIVTLEGYVQMQRYFGSEKVVPIYIEVEDGDRLLRAIERERQGKQQYEEMCRRFLADAADFSEEKLTEAGIKKRFYNRNLETTIREIAEYIKGRDFLNAD